MDAPPARDTIFSNAVELGLRRIVDGPRFSDDPLKNIYRATNLDALYKRLTLFLATPKIFSLLRRKNFIFKQDA